MVTEPTEQPTPLGADVLAGVRRQLRDQLRQRVDARGLAFAPRTQRRVHVRDEALSLLRASGAILPQRELTRMVNEVSDEVVGFGPIEFLLQDPEVTEVMVNGPDDVYVERGGRIERAPDGLFEGEEAVLHLIERIVGPLGLRVDESSPWADARLPDGSRVHAIVPPLSLRGPAVTIRTFSRVPLTADDLVARGALGRRMLGFLAACVRGRVNLIVSGGAGSGKTTLLGVLSGFIPDGERLITIEDAAELRLAKPHVVALEARPANVEGKGQVTVRDLVRNALRMRPDRIIVGEVRGGEALDMLQAMNTGHEGSLSTAHANSCRHLLWRLETMAMMSDVDLPAAHVRNQVASAIDIVVQLSRLRGGAASSGRSPRSRARGGASRSSPPSSGSARVTGVTATSKRPAPFRPSSRRSPIVAKRWATGCSLPRTTRERAGAHPVGDRCCARRAWLWFRAARRRRRPPPAIGPAPEPPNDRPARLVALAVRRGVSRVRTVGPARGLRRCGGRGVRVVAARTTQGPCASCGARRAAGRCRRVDHGCHPSRSLRAAGALVLRRRGTSAAASIPAPARSVARARRAAR